MTRDVALANVARFIGGFGSADTFLDGGSIHVMSTGLIDNRFSDGFQFCAAVTTASSAACQSQLETSAVPAELAPVGSIW